MPKTKKYNLEVIFGEDASDYACDHGFTAAKRAIKDGKIIGEVNKYSFETDADRQVTEQILFDSYGWNGHFCKETN